jgi:hypothetical protein
MCMAYCDSVYLHFGSLAAVLLSHSESEGTTPSRAKLLHCHFLLSRMHGAFVICRTMHIRRANLLTPYCMTQSHQFVTRGA